MIILPLSSRVASKDENKLKNFESIKSMRDLVLTFARFSSMEKIPWAVIVYLLTSSVSLIKFLVFNQFNSAEGIDKLSKEDWLNNRRALFEFICKKGKMMDVTFILLFFKLNK